MDNIELCDKTCIIVNLRRYLDLNALHVGVSLFIVSSIDEYLVKYLVEARNVADLSEVKADALVVYPHLLCGSFIKLTTYNLLVKKELEDLLQTICWPFNSKRVDKKLKN